MNVVVLICEKRKRKFSLGKYLYGNQSKCHKYIQPFNFLRVLHQAKWEQQHLSPFQVMIDLTTMSLVFSHLLVKLLYCTLLWGCPVRVFENCNKSKILQTAYFIVVAFHLTSAFL